MIKVTFKEPTIVNVPDNPNEPSEQIMCLFILCEKLEVLSVYAPENHIVSFGRVLFLNAGNLDKVKSIEHVKPTDYE